MTHEDDLTPEEQAQQAAIAALEADVERESARVGVDWEAAAPEMRTMAEVTEEEASDDGFEVVLGLDVTAMLATLRALPDGAGTAAFLAAFRRRQEEGAPRGDAG